MNIQPQLWIEEQEFLSQTVAGLPANSVIVEIGTAQGGGFNIIAKSRAFPESIEVHTFDPFPGDFAKKIAAENKNCFSHALTSADGIKFWKNINRKISLLIIDGHHSFENVFFDYNAWRVYLEPKSTILFHDFDPPRRGGLSHPGVKFVCDSIIEKCSYTEVIHFYRYLKVKNCLFPEINLEDIKEVIKKFIICSIEQKKIFFQNNHTRLFSLKSLFNYYSRNKNRIEENNINDFVILLAFLENYSKNHQNLILENPKKQGQLLKLLETFDMFLIATKLGFLTEENSESFLAYLSNLSEIDQLNRFLCCINVLGCLLDMIFEL